MDVGAMLREARERRGRSIEDLSRTTKISPTVLQHMESGEFDHLPARVFLRGFLESYAREVGLDPVVTIRRYLGQIDAVTQEAENAADAVSRPRGHARDGGVPTAVGDDDDWPSWIKSAAAAAVLLAFIAGYYGTLRWRTPAAQTQATEAGPVDAVSAPSTPPQAPPETTATPHLEVSAADATRPETNPASTPPQAGTTGSPDSGNAAVVIEGDVLAMDLQPHGLCWVSATVDGMRVVYRLMQPGERQRIQIHDDAYVQIGDAGAFTFALNGATGRPLGRAGQPLTVHITKQNYREFVQP